MTGEVFQEDDEPDFQRVKGRYRKADFIAITNTPDILSPKTPEDKQKRLLQRCVKLTEPGPHMFLLVLQPEDFTEEQKWRLCRVLQHFGDQWFNHSLVIVPTPKESPNVEASYINNPHLQAVISMCGDRHLMQENLQSQDLMTRVDQIVKKNNREHLGSERSKDATSGKHSDKLVQFFSFTSFSFTASCCNESIIKKLGRYVIFDFFIYKVSQNKKMVSLAYPKARL